MRGNRKRGRIDKAPCAAATGRQSEANHIDGHPHKAMETKAAIIWIGAQYVRVTNRAFKLVTGQSVMGGRAASVDNEHLNVGSCSLQQQFEPKLECLQMVHMGYHVKHINYGSEGGQVLNELFIPAIALPGVPLISLLLKF